MPARVDMVGVRHGRLVGVRPAPFGKFGARTIREVAEEATASLRKPAPDKEPSHG